MAGIVKVEDMLSDPDLGLMYDYEEEHKRVLEEEKAYARELGYKEGNVEGHRDGMRVGFEQGIEQGKAILIKDLYSSGMSASDIAKYSKIHIDQVNDILNK